MLTNSELAKSMGQSGGKSSRKDPGRLGSRGGYFYFRRRLVILLGIFLAGMFVQVGAGRALDIHNPVHVYFTKGSAKLDRHARAAVEDFAAAIRDLPVEKVEILGRSDRISVSKKNPHGNNLALSEARAEAVRLLLAEKSGLPSECIVSEGVGTADTGGGAEPSERRVEMRAFFKTEGLLAGEASIGAYQLSSPPPKGGGKMERKDGLITMALRNIDVAEAFEMLSKKERVNIVLEKGVSGTISVNLFEVTLNEALNAIAEAAGFRVDVGPIGYIIRQPGPAKEAAAPPPEETVIRTFKVQYSKPEDVEKILGKHLSGAGKITRLEDRQLVVIEDVPTNMERVARLLREVDKQPRQILIEAKILEIILDNSEFFGLDWAKLFTQANTTGSFGLSGFANQQATGFVATLVNSERLNFVLNVLSERGRLHALSTPKLLALENQEAAVIIGDRKGYKVTTTINLVTTESIEFLESGIILKVIPYVDEQDRILMRIHPEVSSGSIQSGIPSQTTTEVTTNLLAENGQPIFIGGLMKNKREKSRDGVPVLGSIPVIGLVFSSTKETIETTETVVVITPTIVETGRDSVLAEEARKLEVIDSSLQEESVRRLGTPQELKEKTYFE